MDVLATIAGVVGFVGSVCTIVLFTEDRAEKFRRREKRRKKMMQKENGLGDQRHP